MGNMATLASHDIPLNDALMCQNTHTAVVNKSHTEPMALQEWVRGCELVHLAGFHIRNGIFPEVIYTTQFLDRRLCNLIPSMI